MEEISSSNLLHLALLFVPLSLVFLVYKRKSAQVKLPPGTKEWPFLGESLEFVKDARRGHPEKFINDRAQKYSPNVFRTSLLGENMAVFCGASGNKVLFTSENKYVTVWWPLSILKAMLIPDPDEISAKEESERSRGIMSEFLKPEGLQHLIPVMDSMAREQLETDWYPNKEVKVFALSKKYTFTLACRLFMSVRDPNLVTKLSGHYGLLTPGMLSVPINFSVTPYNRAIKASKKEEPYLDLLTRMLLFKDENGTLKSERNIAINILALLIASHDTTSTALTFVLKFLAEHPQVHSKVFKEQEEIAKSKGPNELLNWDDIQGMKYSWCVAWETMRLLPPSQGTFREAITDFTYAGFTIPKGWKAFWTVYSTHKNPKYFPDPEKFDPSRYAWLEILIFLHNLVTKLKWEKVIADEKIIIDPTPIPVNGFPIYLRPI
ncbi:hypothetical protein P3X46_021835 [Hevea brasiliensis]|uniref:Cytochrome P450 n=1 Tax=Hevea brasiliensis TaxID=3981 RepID=A0ABQ9LIS2_HEVBR|nr:hypothetical protein P3X46_021835 [Hevea brasiliensis]